MITLRKETEKDIPEIIRVNDRAFERKTEGKLINTLRKTNDYISELSIIAEYNQQIVGHILFYPIQIHDGDKKHPSLTLAPMSVLPEFQKKSIGKLLVTYALQVAKDLGHKSVVVLGHPSYYPKFGFKTASKWNIKSPFPAPEEVFMAVELESESLANVSGTVRYPEAFDEL